MPLKDAIITIVSVIAIMGLALVPRLFPDDADGGPDSFPVSQNGKRFSELEEFRGFPLRLTGSADISPSLLDALQQIDCQTILRMDNLRINSLQLAAREGLLDQEKPFSYAMLSLDHSNADSLHYRLEIFQVSPTKDTVRIANYGKGRGGSDPAVLADVICRFVNK